MKSKITKDFTKFNEKMKKLKKKAVTIEVGLFNAEQADYWNTETPTKSLDHGSQSK